MLLLNFFSFFLSFFSFILFHFISFHFILFTFFFLYFSSTLRFFCFISIYFKEYFNNCPVLRVPGRVYPVDIYHSKIKQIMTAKGPSNSSYVQVFVIIIHYSSFIILDFNFTYYSFSYSFFIFFLLFFFFSCKYLSGNFILLLLSFLNLYLPISPLEH